MTDRRYGIRRSDGQWYIGTVDSRPVFAAGGHAASFASEEAAVVRLRGLSRLDASGHTFEVLPVGDVHAS